MNLTVFGKGLIGLGLVLIVVGAFLLLAQRAPFLGRLPGDITIQRKNSTFYFPLATSLVLSLLASFLVWLWSKRSP